MGRSDRTYLYYNIYIYIYNRGEAQERAVLRVKKFFLVFQEVVTVRTVWNLNPLFSLQLDVCHDCHTTVTVTRCDRLKGTQRCLVARENFPPLNTKIQKAKAAS